MQRKMSASRLWAARGLGITTTVLVMAYLAAPTARAGGLQWNQFDVVTSGDFSSSSDVEGWTMVGGNVSGTWNGSIHQNTPATTPTVYVGGTLSGNLNLQYGSVRVTNAGDHSGATVNFNGGTGAGYIYDTATNKVATDIQTVTSQLSSVHSGFDRLTANNTASLSSGTLTFDATSYNAQGLAVFDVTTTELSGLSAIQLGTVDSHVKGIIINVSSNGGNQTTLSEAANFNGWSSTTDAMTLWNFGSDVTSISAHTAWQGSMIALGAQLSSSNDMNGGVYVKSLEASSEVHLPLYSGPTAASVPEPSTLVLAGIGMAGVLVMAARRRRAA